VTQSIVIKITITVLAGLVLAGPLTTYLIVRQPSCPEPEFLPAPITGRPWEQNTQPAPKVKTITDLDLGAPAGNDPSAK
jgi:hypothetical protein